MRPYLARTESEIASLHACRVLSCEVLEFPAIGPVPFGAMLLADLGATVLRLDRPEDAGLGVQRPPRFNVARRAQRAPGTAQSFVDRGAINMSS